MAAVTSERGSMAGPVRSGMLVLALPAILLILLFFVAALALLVQQSFSTFVPGRVTTSSAFTVENYAKLFQPAFVGFFLDTFRLSLIAALISLVLAYVVAYFVARRRSGVVRTVVVALLVGMLFVGGMVRVYGLSLSLGTAGLLGFAREWFGTMPNNIYLLEANVVLGIVHYTAPLMALTLIGALRNIDPRYEGVAENLGASRIRAVFDTTVLLSLPAIASAFFLGYAMAVSAFTIPLFLGNGIVVAITMLIYQRFSEIPNYPFGAAISVALLVTSLLSVFVGAVLFGLLKRWMRLA
jgi:ABC-type spermidine/putrescine transport system permease subunit I